MATNSVRFNIDVDVGKARSNLGKFNSELDELDKSNKKAQKSTTSLAKGLTAFGAALGGATLLIKKAVDDASDLEESTSKFRTIFSGVGKEADRMSSKLQESFGLSALEANKLLGATGDLLTGFGMMPGAALRMSGSVQELAVDLASFTNIQGGAERASKAITSAMLGEREALKSLGIVISEEQVKQELAIMGKEKATGATLLAAKAEAVLAIATRQSVNAIGDYARTADSFANQSRLMGSRITDLSATLGSKLIPIIKPVISLISDSIEAFLRASPAIQNTVIALGALAAALGVIKIAAVAFGVSFQAALLPITLISAAIAAVVAAAIYLKDNWSEVALTIQLKIKQLSRGFDRFVAGVKLANLIIVDALLGAVKDGFQPVIGAIDEIIGAYNRLTNSSVQRASILINNNKAELESEIETQRGILEALALKSEEELILIDELNQAKADKEDQKNAMDTERDIARNEAILSREQAKKDALEMQDKKRAHAQKKRREEELRANVGLSDAIFKIRVALGQNMTKQQVSDQNAQISNYQGFSSFMMQNLKKSNKEEFAVYKAFAIQKAIISTYQAATGAYSALAPIPFIGPALGAAAAAAAVALGLRMVATIAASSPPAAAEGALIKGSTTGRVIRAGENGRDEAIIPLQNTEAMQRLGLDGNRQGGGTTINVMLDAETIVADDALGRKFAEYIDKLLFDLNRNNGSTFAEAIS